MNELELEDKEALGFESYSIEELENISEDNKNKFISRVISPESINIYKELISKIV